MCPAVLFALLVPALAHGAGGFTSPKRLGRLKAQVGAQSVPIETPCVRQNPDRTCSQRALGQVMTRIRSKKTVRVLQLGDSHIASDYITGMIRHRLQSRFGDAGRGFISVDQRVRFGGRRLKRAKRDWIRDRIVDRGREGRPYGFSGMSLASKRAGARITYRVTPSDQVVRVYFEADKPEALEVRLGKKRLARSAETPVVEVKLPEDRTKASTLTLVARRRGVAVYGLSFDGAGPGIIYESIGPVGADARVYLDLERESFTRNLTSHRPDLVVLMLGGNDALKVRKKWRTIDEVEQDYRRLVELLQRTLPDAELMVWAPMDAGDRRGRRVVSKGRLTDVRVRQTRVVDATKVAFWDALKAMGGVGSIARWDRARIMNADLVHPRKRAADLIGALFADAFLEVYDRTGSETAEGLQ